ncbi:long-chain-fatty-acid--CoA ligase [Calderihabitans maritimus]|uniref:Acetyl-CoA synthetase (AMP-forming)/AMP-acid ligases II n=1 Tax=Calderihabitans maritimus TaxID=1246530 RepID=A0A1Z5HNU7_9FIRM|nr:long-chain fatty acid--CoA ligase [Calderihabitans maritimus]GAW91184.1 acetyl-CoA synthetase (AMP-forming)/AMP-acid ligases II [Calderihabitans maritimus]
MKIHDLAALHAEATERTALEYQNTRISYAELNKAVNAYASYFISQGIQPGDRVALALPNCPEFIFAYLGITKAGGVAVPLNLMLTPEEIVYIVKDAAPRILLTQPDMANKLSALVSNSPTQAVPLDEKTKSQILSQPLTSFPEVDDDQVCTFLYTSGTTGHPKGVMLSHRNFVSNVKSLKDFSKLGPEENFLAVLPMFHSFGWTVCVLTPLYLGAKITILDAFRPKEVLDTLANKDITIFCGVPSMFAVLQKMSPRNTFPKLWLVISGGAALPGEVQRGFEEKFGVSIVEGYGLTEASPVVCLNPIYGKRKAGSIGVSIPDVEAKVIDETGRELPPGEVGELVVRGPNVMKGYYRREADTRETLKDGWLHTGDLARRDEDGYFFIAGRKKELIITAGFNVYPREVEELLLSYPGVAEAAVIGVPHPVKGETVKAVIVPEEGHTLERQEIIKYLKERLAQYKIPEIIEFTDSLPKGPGGKILKRLLQ